jgi:hypothetical protein
MKKTILTHSASTDRKGGIYARVPVEFVPATGENVISVFSAWNEGRDPETVLAIAERRARRVLDGEGIRPVKRVPKTKTVRSIPTLGTVVESTPLSERAEVAVAVLWAAFLARRSLHAGDIASAVVESVRVGTLSERMLVLPYEAEVVRLASNRRKGADATREKFASRRSEWARRVELLCPDGNGVTKACRTVADEWTREQRLRSPNMESLRESIRAAYRTVFPAKPRD